MESNGVQFKLGELSQFKDDVLDRFDKLEKQLGCMDRKIMDLRMWRIKVVASTGGISSVVTFLLTYLLK